MRLAVTVLALLLCAACDPAKSWYHGDLPRIPVEIDGETVTVLDHGAGRFAAFGGGDPYLDSRRTIMQRQIAAIEKLSGCRMKQAACLEDAPILQVAVTC